MRGRKTALKPELAPEEVREIEQLMRSLTAPVGVVRRARAVFLVSQGNSLCDVAAYVDLTVKHLRKWLRRFVNAPEGERLKALYDRPRPGRRPVFSPCGSFEYRQDGVRTA